MTFEEVLNEAKIEDGLRAMDEYKAQFGAFSAEAHLRARQALAKAGLLDLDGETANSGSPAEEIDKEHVGG